MPLGHIAMCRTCYLRRSPPLTSMDHTTFYLFGCGCSLLGFLAGYLPTYIEKRITEVRDRQAACDHVWGPTTYIGAYPLRNCKWCHKQQHYHGDKETGEWRDR